VAHHHRRKAQDIGELWRRYSTGTGAYRIKFLLTSDTRSTFLRAWYWTLLRTLRGGFPMRNFIWEVQGAARYLAIRLRRRIVSGKGKQA
jgi:hypothetical protein